MNIGICIPHKEDMAERFRIAVENGFHHCQLTSWNPALWTKEEAEKLKSLCQQYDMTITAFWCGWVGPRVWDFYQGQETLGLVPPAFRYVRMQNLIDGADFALSIGVTDVVSHMGYIPENPYDPNFPALVAALKAVSKHLAANGQNLLFESGQETPVTMLRCFEEIGTDNLYVNLDTANLILYGKANPVDALDVIGTRVRGVHAKDGFYPTDGHHLGKEVKVGTGKVDFPTFIARLKELGYDGSLTIEREISGEQQLKDILETKAYLEKLIG